MSTDREDKIEELVRLQNLHVKMDALLLANRHLTKLLDDAIKETNTKRTELEASLTLRRIII